MGLVQLQHLVQLDSRPGLGQHRNMSPTELSTPALILGLGVLKRNLDRMAGRLDRLGVAVRPHIKTHKCSEIAALQRDAGAVGLTVSTLREAAAFADAGFTDLTWAFPLILSRVDEAREIAERATLRLLLDSPEAVDALEASGFAAHVWLKVDCGYHRAGVDPASRRAGELARRLHDSESLVFDGILTHAGHSYHGRGRDDLLRVAEEERRVMADFADRLRGDGVEVRGVSVGSTPTMSVARSLDGVTEARPGNYAFHDFTQCCLGTCTVSDCALTVLTSVVSSQPRHSVIDAGALSLSRDAGPGWVEPASFGRIFRDDGSGELDDGMWVTSLSQEHGIVNRPLPVGTRLRVLPNHSCLVVPNFERYHVVEGERVVDRWAAL